MSVCLVLKPKATIASFAGPQSQMDRGMPLKLQLYLFGELILTSIISDINNSCTEWNLHL